MKCCIALIVIIILMFNNIVYCSPKIKCIKKEEKYMSTRGLLVDQLKFYITDQTEISNLISFIKKYKMTEICLYTSGVIPEKSAELKILINKARLAGVKVVRIAAGSEAEVDRVLFFSSQYTPIDGLWLEYEWWNHNPRDFSRAIQILQYMKNKAPGEMNIGAYIGWLKDGELQELVNHTDKLFIHSYVDDGYRTYKYTKSRIDQYKDISLPCYITKAKFMPIFSAEWRPKEICDQGRANPEFSNSMCFMGPWIKDHDSIIQSGFTSAENAYKEAEKNDRPLLSFLSKTWRNKAEIDGFYFFAYTHARDALKK